MSSPPGFPVSLPRTSHCNCSITQSEKWKKSALTHSLESTLDRVNVLGDGHSGHTGCVNALSWAADGELLLSAGDDTTVRIWRMNCSDTETDYPFTCRTLIHTGHRNNIFNAQMLPYSSQIVTVAADSQVRVLDVGEGIGLSEKEVEYSSQAACVRVLRCHSDRVKRIVTEESPDLFLTVSEDGCVRQHDLRSPHACSSECPSPVVKLAHELSTLALSPLTPYQFVVAGDSPFGYLFDRRYASRSVEEEWGNVPAASGNDAALCVRRFGRASPLSRASSNTEHITGARMSVNNGHEVLLSYSSDAVYLFSTRDDPHSEKQDTTSILPPNDERQEGQSSKETAVDDALAEVDTAVEEEEPEAEDDDDDDDDEDSRMAWEHTSDFLDIEDNSQSGDSAWYPKVPVVYPRRRYAGACNVQTVKDVNFIGAHDEYVASGSDDGNFFLWHKDTAEIAGIYEGDGSVVNVIEGHPHLPVIAVSGIDTTVKLFAPVRGDKVSNWTRIGQVESIVQRNATASERSLGRRINISHLLMHYRRARVLLHEELSGDSPSTGYQCTPQ